MWKHARRQSHFGDIGASQQNSIIPLGPAKIDGRLVMPIRPEVFNPQLPWCAYLFLEELCDQFEKTSFPRQASLRRYNCRKSGWIADYRVSMDKACFAMFVLYAPRFPTNYCLLGPQTQRIDLGSYTPKASRKNCSSRSTVG